MAEWSMAVVLKRVGSVMTQRLYFAGVLGAGICRIAPKFRQIGPRLSST
jgi:hypothetical protein